MLSLPDTFLSVISIFVPVFSRPVWQHAKVLLTGAVLAPGTRTVASILRIMGKTDEPQQFPLGRNIPIRSMSEGSLGAI
jgi:hypothetical protein